MEGSLTCTRGTGETWIAGHTRSRPPGGATGGDLMSCPGPVGFAVGPTSEVALAELRAELMIHLAPESRT
jgi:hypothetical protein